LANVVETKSTSVFNLKVNSFCYSKRELFTFVNLLGHVIEARVLDVEHQAIRRQVDLVLWAGNLRRGEQTIILKLQHRLSESYRARNALSGTQLAQFEVGWVLLDGQT